jgi:hypothetical protein
VDECDRGAGVGALAGYLIARARSDRNRSSPDVRAINKAPGPDLWACATEREFNTTMRLTTIHRYMAASFAVAPAFTSLCPRRMKRPVGVRRDSSTSAYRSRVDVQPLAGQHPNASTTVFDRLTFAEVTTRKRRGRLIEPLDVMNELDVSLHVLTPRVHIAGLEGFRSDGLFEVLAKMRLHRASEQCHDWFD